MTGTQAEAEQKIGADFNASEFTPPRGFQEGLTNMLESSRLRQFLEDLRITEKGRLMISELDSYLFNTKSLGFENLGTLSQLPPEAQDEMINLLEQFKDTHPIQKNELAKQIKNLILKQIKNLNKITPEHAQELSEAHDAKTKTETKATWLAETPEDLREMYDLLTNGPLKEYLNALDSSTISKLDRDIFNSYSSWLRFPGAQTQEQQNELIVLLESYLSLADDPATKERKRETAIKIDEFLINLDYLPPAKGAQIIREDTRMQTQ